MLVTFAAGTSGAWRVVDQRAVRGDGLPRAVALDVVGTARPQDPAPLGTCWTLRGVTGHERYTTRAERELLDRARAPLDRPASTVAVLVPVLKADGWWGLAQDERRAVLERSRHVPLGLTALPAVARRLAHGRDLGEPFDFLTWFELAPRHLPLFDELLAALRATEEWTWVEREVEVRLERGAAPAEPTDDADGRR